MNAVVFTEDYDLNTALVLRELFPKLDEFNGPPFVMPKLPADAPREIPVMQFRNLENSKHFLISKARTSYQLTSNQEQLPLETVLTNACDALIAFKTAVSCRISRIGVVVVSSVEQPEPAMFLAKHFCKDTVLDSPLNRPENFELHAHKRFMIGDFCVNSWAKTRALLDNVKPSVQFEQDINTIHQEGVSADFSEGQLKAFFKLLPNEIATIKNRYFPAD